MTLCGLHGVPASISEDEMVLSPVNQNGLPDPQQVTEIYFSHFFSEGIILEQNLFGVSSEARQ